MKVKDYFISENNEQDCYHISELISSDENIENFSKYLKNIKDKKNINNKNICIYPTLEALDSDNQKILKSIFDSNFDTNYPIWRSILATYSIKNSDNKTWLKNKDKFFVLDLNTEIPSINIIEIEGNVYKHHPALSLEEIDEENNIINEISLKSYLRKYLEEYIISYNIEMNENEKNNLISSGKIYKIIFDNKKYLSNDKKFFLVRDKDVLKNVGSEFYSSLQKFISKFFENKIRKLLIISDYLGEKYSINKMVIKTMKEEELLFGKEEIIEKIKSGKTPWSEYLPNLNLETIKDGHFYNLELIKKNQGVEIILGKESIINISEELVLPKDKKIIRFPLYSRDSNNKKLYFLEIRSDLFPLKENLVVNLEVIYSYGNKEPYKIDLKAKDIDSSKFSTKWTENIDDLEIKSLDFLGENNKNDSDGIVGINEIIKKILEKTEKYFFKRSEKWLLVNIPWRELDRESISSLKTSIENIYNNFYTPNQWVLTTTNASVKVVYRRNFEKFEEVITALWDTEKYLTKYDKKLSDILKTEEKEDNSKTLSIEDAKEFLSKFDHIKFDDSNIEIMWREYCDNPNSKEAEKNKKNPTCYRIKNMEVWNWTKISFLLFPYEYHKISDISIWWNKNLNKWSYKMDDEEEKYKEQENNFSDPSEKEQYKFKNFFINVITASQSWKKQQVEDYVEDNRSQESEIIRTIKNTNLLWKNWTLTKLKPILDVAYNDIKITETESDLIININNAKVNYSSEKKNYFWRFKSEYKYKSGKINSFFNPEIQITNDNWENIISWTSIKLSWLIKLDDFKKIMDSFFKNMSSIIDAVTYVSQNDSSEDLRITYLPQIDKFQIISKNIKIFIIWDEIELFSSFWKKILEKNEKISKIRWLLEYK